MNTQTIFKFPDMLVAGSDSAFFCSCTAAELQFTRNAAIDVAAGCLAAPRPNVEVDSAAPWQRVPPLDNVQVAAVRAAWYEPWPPLRAPRGGDPTTCLYSCTDTKI